MIDHDEEVLEHAGQRRQTMIKKLRQGACAKGGVGVWKREFQKLAPLPLPPACALSYRTEFNEICSGWCLCLMRMTD